MRRNFNGNKGAVTVEACISFPIFLCFFLFLIFFIRLVCMYMVLEHTANETAKQLAAFSYPMKFINELEDETFLDKDTYDIPSFSEELEKAKTYISGSILDGDFFSILITGGGNLQDKDKNISKFFDSISEDAIGSLKTGVRGYITRKFGTKYYDLKNKLKYTAVSLISEKYIEGSYLDANNLEYMLIQIPQSNVEYGIRSKDTAYMNACKVIGYNPGKDDVVVALRYKVEIPIPFFKDRVVMLEHVGVERAWLNGSNGVYSRDFLYEPGSESEDSSEGDSSIEENYRKLGDETVYITNTGEKYHKQDCPCLSSSKKPIKLSDAEDRGYKECGVCSNKGKWNFYK